MKRITSDIVYWMTNLIALAVLVVAFVLYSIWVGGFVIYNKLRNRDH